MLAVSPVIIGSESIEIVLGKNQSEYAPLPAIYLDTPARAMVTRWRLSDEERATVANGGDIVLQQLTFCQPFHPVNLQVVLPDAAPMLVEDPL